MFDPANVRHVTQHIHCGATISQGRKCVAMTNYECVHCRGGLCGRHQNNHYCKQSRDTK